MPKAGFSPSHHSTTSSIGKVPSPEQGPYPQTSDDDATSEVGLVDPSSLKKGRMDFLAKSRFQSLVGKRAFQAMSLMPSDSGLGASPITGTTMRTLT